MAKRKYTHVQQLDRQIVEMRDAGYTTREIAEELGLEKRQIQTWVTRYNRRQEKIARGVPMASKGRPRTRLLTTKEEYDREIARLQMENKLLRDFLQSLERM